ncbi:MAG: YggT family protein [Pseudomonadota bacterium]|jgi:YggT family protein
MLNQAAQFILETVLSLFLFAALLRFYLQLLRAPFRHPFSQFIAALTNFAVLPLRRVIPGLWGVDLASLVLAWVVQLLLLLGLAWLGGFPFSAATASVYFGLAFLAAVKLVRLSLYLLMAAVFVQAIMSWINPHNPLAPVTDSLTRPFLRLAQRIVPPIAGVDLSPLVIFFVCQLLLMLPVAWLEQLAGRLY